MNRNGKPKALHPVDGRMMTVDEIAAMIGITTTALRCRRCKLGGASYQLIVEMYRSNQLGHRGDRSGRYLIDGRWMTRREIAGELGVNASSISTWRWQNGATMAQAVEHFREWNRRGRVPNPTGSGGRPPRLYRVGNHDWTVNEVAGKFGVHRSAVVRVLKTRGGDMAATLTYYRERARKKDLKARAKAEAEIMRILGY